MDGDRKSASSIQQVSHGVSIKHVCGRVCVPPAFGQIFYEDVLMAAFYFGYPLLIESNKYGIARYFESKVTMDT